MLTRTVAHFMGSQFFAVVPGAYAPGSMLAPALQAESGLFVCRPTADCLCKATVPFTAWWAWVAC
jgi:hypothetical protein